MANVSALLVSDLGKYVKTPAYNGQDPTFTSEKVKGDAQLKVSAGVHTLDVRLHGLVGTLRIQATLRADPSESDWFDVRLESPDLDNATVLTEIECLVPTSTHTIYIARGNFYWLRCVVDPYTAGGIDHIRVLF